MRKIVFSSLPIFFLILTSSFNAQTHQVSQATIATYINYTELSIHRLYKEFVAASRTDLRALNQSIRLQEEAVELYKKGSYERAYCQSEQAREAAVEALALLINDEAEYYRHSTGDPQQSPACEGHLPTPLAADSNSPLQTLNDTPGLLHVTP